MTVRRIFGWACCGLLVWQGVAYAQGPALEKQPDFDVGDKWTYRYTDIGDRKEAVLYTHQAFKSANGSGWIYGESMDPESKRKSFILRYDYKRGEVKENFEFNRTNPREPGQRYRNTMPNDDELQFPIVVGKQYKIVREWSNGEGYNRYDVAVEAFEKVSVGAGEFDAFRIRMSGRWIRTEVGGPSGQAETTYWYAPAAKRVIKTVFMEANTRGTPWSQSQTELVSWEPQAALPVAFD